MRVTNEKIAIFVIIFVLVSILTLTGLAYNYREEIDFSQRIRTIKNRVFAKEEVSLKFNLVAGINEKSLRVKFSIPCENIKQRHCILKRLPIIKHELLMSMSRPEVMRSIEERDFNAMKRGSLRIINSVSNEAINRLYVEFFFLN